MSFFSWFSSKPSQNPVGTDRESPDSDSSDLTREERTRPVAGSRPRVSQPQPLKTPAEQQPGQKSQRHAKRELLYVAVREAMIRAGVLSASYKFKVLSLDPRGDQFMVMMDLAQEFGGQTGRLADIEVMIAQSAKSRYNIRVTAVYWRMSELVSIAHPRPAARTASHPTPGAELLRAGAVAAAGRQVLAPAMTETAAPALLVPEPPIERYEPIQADEVAAFKQALAAASATGATPRPDAGVVGRSGANSYALLTGFEDTEMPDTPAVVPALSSTQYGDLV